MASLLSPSAPFSLQSKANLCNVGALSTSLRAFAPKGRRGRNGSILRTRASVEGDTLVKESESLQTKNDIGALTLHHVGILCENLERSLHFYQNLLGLEMNEARPNEKLPYRGAWLWVGDEMIHLMELSNPDPLTGRPQHGGLDRHTCIAIKDVYKLKAILDEAGIPYTMSRSGRAALFTRDPDANALEFVQGKISAAEIQEIIEEADMDRDGEINFDEFIRMNHTGIKRSLGIYQLMSSYPIGC